MEVAVPIHFAVNDFVPNLNYSDQALIDYWLEQDAPDLTANGYPVRNTFIDFQKLVITGARKRAQSESDLMAVLEDEGGRHNPSIWGDDEQWMGINESMHFNDFNLGVDYGALFIYAFDRDSPDFAANDSSARSEAHAMECEVHQTTCDGTCTGCYWHTKNNSCRWGDECKFCHRCEWVRRT